MWHEGDEEGHRDQVDRDNLSRGLQALCVDIEALGLCLRVLFFSPGDSVKHIGIN